MTTRSGSSPAPAAAWASTSPRPPSPPGTRVVATGRDADRVSRSAIGEHENLLAVALDITDPAAADAAAEAAVERFGRIDVLVNNAGQLLRRLLRGDQPRAVPRADGDELLRPAQRHPRDPAGHARSSAAATSSPSPPRPASIGQEFCAAYAASKFALEGWMESLRFDVEPFGIHDHGVEPGFFRTELLVEGASTIWPELRIEDYAERTDADHRGVEEHERPAGRRPREARRALVTLSDSGRAAAALRRRRRRLGRGRAEPRDHPEQIDAQPRAVRVTLLRLTTSLTRTHPPRLRTNRTPSVDSH